MLTVKYIQPSGDESVQQAMNVRKAWELTPLEARHTPSDTQREIVYAECEGGHTARFDAGTIYVMNDAGATVAKYDLGG